MGKRSASNAVEAASSSGPRSWPRSPLRSKKLSSPERNAARNPTACGVKSTCDEPEHKRAGSIYPLQVVDDHQQGFLRARLREQRQSRVTNHELIRRWAVAQTQRHLERRALRWIQSFDFVEEGVQNLIQPSEAEVRLELRARGAQYAKAGIRCMCCCSVQENGLAYSGGSRQQERVTGGRRLVDERPEELEFLVPSEQQRRVLME